jgi:RNA polymerase sigma-70 factor (ECF subfamily)
LETDEQLVMKARGGDREAFSVLMVRYERPVLAEAMSVLRSWHDARDVAQDAFFTAYRKLKHLWTPGKFGPWVLQIARRSAWRYRKRRSYGACEAIPPDLPTRQTDLLNSDLPQDLLVLVTRLPDQERVVVMLRYLDGLQPVNISQVLGRPVGTVTKQLSRAHRRLRKWLGKEVDHEQP